VTRWRSAARVVQGFPSGDPFTGGDIFNQQTVADYNNWFETTCGSLNPHYAVAGASGVVAGQQLLTPRQLCVGARFEF
jgi:hypothetical protein